MDTLYYVDTGGGGASAGTEADPINWEGINGITFETGDYVMFNSDQSHVVGDVIYINSYGTEASPVTFTSYGGGRATIGTTGGHDLFSIGNCENVTFTNLTLNTESTGANIFEATGLYSNFRLYDIKVESGGTFWDEPVGSSGGELLVYGCNLNYLWEDCFDVSSCTGEVHSSTISYAGSDTDGNINWNTGGGSAFNLEGIGNFNVRDSILLNNKRGCVSSSTQTMDLRRCLLKNVNALLTGEVPSDSYLVSISDGIGGIRDSILHMSGTMQGYIVHIAGGPGAVLQNCGIVNQVENALSISIVAVGGSFFLVSNNLIYHSTDTAIPFYTGGGVNIAAYNRYDLTAGGMNNFNGSQSWETYTGNGGESALGTLPNSSSTGSSRLTPFWYTTMTDVLTTGSPLIGIGSSTIGEGNRDVGLMQRSVTGSVDMGPFAAIPPDRIRLSKGGYGRYGYAPN